MWLNNEIRTNVHALGSLLLEVSSSKLSAYPLTQGRHDRNWCYNNTSNALFVLSVCHTSNAFWNIHSTFFNPPQNSTGILFQNWLNNSILSIKNIQCNRIYAQNQLQHRICIFHSLAWSMQVNRKLNNFCTTILPLKHWIQLI